jgi:hypothetical protein
MEALWYKMAKIKKILKLVRSCSCSLPMMDPGGSEAGMSALTGASTILMLLRLMSRLYLGTQV